MITLHACITAGPFSFAVPLLKERMEPSVLTSIEDGSSVITSNTETADQMRAALAVEPETPLEAPKADAPKAEEPDAPEPGDELVAKAETAMARDDQGRFVKPKKGSIPRMIWERESAKREAAAAKAELERLRAERAQERQPDPKPDAKPTGDKFQPYDEYLAAHPEASYEDYIDARTQFSYQRLREQERTEESRKRDLDEYSKHSQAHIARVASARSRYADFDAVLASADQAHQIANAPFSPALLKAILESDKSADITYFLGQHPEESIQLAREALELPLTAAPMLRRHLESRLTAAPSGPAASAPPISQAKAPIKPVGASPSAADPNPDDLPFAEYVRVMNAREKVGQR